MRYHTIQVYSDAAVYPHVTGLGVVIKDTQGHVIAWRHKVMRAVNGSNEAEYHALIFAMEQARTFSPRRVEVFSDSKLVIEQMRGYYRVNHDSLRALHRRAQELRDGFERVTFHHISRERNQLADAMAEEAVQMKGEEKRGRDRGIERSEKGEKGEGVIG